jgi:hypothetical protein
VAGKNNPCSQAEVHSEPTRLERGSGSKEQSERHRPGEAEVMSTALVQHMSEHD